MATPFETNLSCNIRIKRNFSCRMFSRIKRLDTTMQIEFLVKKMNFMPLPNLQGLAVCHEKFNLFVRSLFIFLTLPILFLIFFLFFVFLTIFWYFQH